MIDSATIELTAGNGGDGAVSFRREKYEPAGGPAGGDGGDGGNIYIVSTSEMSTLIDYTFKDKYKAGNGEHGGKNKKFGKKGEGLILKVPVGTYIREKESKVIIKDFKKDGEKFLIAKGGRGGKGNVHFKSSTRRTPRFAQKGSLGNHIEVILELKLLADVGLVGLPNVGKSTLISVISNAKPKIANYHFTTLDPNLGVVKVDDSRSFIVADIPGLIEGASEGIGLGDEFLKHIERCRILVHVIDISSSEGRNPIDDFETIKNELKNYNEKLIDKKQIIVLNKIDIDYNNNSDDFINKYKNEYDIFKISSATTKGTKELVNKLTEELSHIEKKAYELEEEVDESFLEKYYNREIVFDLNFMKEDNIYIAYGKRIENLLERINFEDYDSRMYFEKTLRDMGVFEEFTKMGIQDGDIIKIGQLEFEYYE
ncbi:MAG: GTPase ObgE [Peptoniphilaceae bacterium]|nr:GTPase ObgE [Peptoniphilaceae bacterium]